MGGSGRKAGIAVGIAVVLAAVIGGGLFYVNRPASANGPGGLSSFAVGPMAKLETPTGTAPAPDYVFKAPDGTDARFSDFRGKVVAVNLWAMWCAPCRSEMPTLAALARAYPATDLVVVPINVDIDPQNVAKAPAFLTDNAPLALYSDPKFELPFRFLGKGGMPQTILLDRQGRVRAALTGGADWSSPEARALVDALLAENS